MKRSFACAFRGVARCYRSELHMRIHTAVAFYVLLAAAITGVSKWEWVCILICIGAVMGAELMNTAVEQLCDALHPERAASIGLVKDMAAGAVLVSAAASAVSGGIIFFNCEVAGRAAAFMRGHTVTAALIVLSVPCALFLIFRRREDGNKIGNDRGRRTP